MPDRWWLVADVGASNCRFAVATAPRVLAAQATFQTAATPAFEDALMRYLRDRHLDHRTCAGAVIAAAGPVEEEKVSLTNAPWTVDARAVGKCLGGAPVRLMNDLEGVAQLLPHLEPADSAALWPVNKPRLTSARLTVNVGTGFGAAAAIPSAGGWAFVSGEAGHMSLESLIGTSVETVLSGEGIVNLYAALGGAGTGPGSAIFARRRDDAVAGQTVEVLAALLGKVAGDLVLAFGAWDGVYLCGSVALGIASIADLQKLRSAFTSKMAMSARMQAVPVHRLTIPEPALVGLSYAAANL